MEIHPVYDFETKTWFVEGFEHEASTIAELVRKIPKPVVVRDYYAAGMQAPVVRYPSLTIEDLLSRPDSVGARPQKFDTRRKKTKEAAPIVERGVEARKPPKPRISLPKNEEPAPLLKSTRSLSPAERHELREQILNMWVKGVPGREIARTLGVTVNWVSANVVPKARRQGDPRAVIRIPNSIGVSRNGSI